MQNAESTNVWDGLMNFGVPPAALTKTEDVLVIGLCATSSETFTNKIKLWSDLVIHFS